ncbi:phytanoyl-CoA dioxygenase, peroxisomal-like isoform X1 [Zootermopsis nevadensis]|uniref:phytanoyl-CoA dioxygenase, peroxisomal-like isoform X1 n=1 Tax=Zootermopsis nevadensis TaxID=136037 RepID=UPI000B8EE25A|nr:phytanoyl-CoA dioxygenase, peroxisomal-like isoform X1 [Zootermopsis nevadensis]XP_021926900.1 phytanoyl-CoA dioxygenase, peroxisomal-like isoform X1 [Zootermopsis nevadensis]XP_021926902.1 phytanoyl-CoA dioxygenase, peroxisomal-like isoform X1 [Zootermopsis nevadensis]XP_021926903.1 phytanoyl-CoA dioxygenase, peroxisomal-like isoform X1 [Zootermopsis nevadensis]
MASDRMKIIFHHIHGRNAIFAPVSFKKIRLIETGALAEHLPTEHFRYTTNNPLLSSSQRKFYEENGYIVIPRLVEEKLIEELCKRFVDVCEGRVPRGNMTLMKDISLKDTNATGEYLYYKLQDIVWEEVLSKYILHPKVLDYVECFTGPNIKAMHSMLINKPPYSGIHPLHQDLHYFPFRPADRIVAAWTAMESVNENNGCLVVIPGTHKGELQSHDYPKWNHTINKAFHRVEGFENQPLVSLEMEKGDTVFFHPILVHGSGINKTKGFRKAISCHYAASECYYIDVEGTTQQNIAKEVEDMASRRGLPFDFQSVWKYRSRLARGKELSL